MNRRLLGAVASTTAVATSLAFGATANADAQPVTAAGAVSSVDAAQTSTARPDSLPDPKADQAADLRQAAVDQVIKGKATIKMVNGKRVIEVAAPSGKGKNAKKGRYVEYDANQQAKVFTVLAQFGEKTKAATGGAPGPMAGQIAQPDRSKDNSTYWSPSFDRQHYLDMMFGHGESFKDFYAKQSQGRFDVEGDVSDWVTVPYNEARYGSNKINEASGYWNFVADAMNAWYAQQKAAGKTDAQIKDYLAQFDVWDRYDYNGNGNFNEPDGYIDHIQIIHAGEGEEAGGGAQGEDAIWSHRWSVQGGFGAGPDNFHAGGTQIGNSGIWVRDYTTEPENGGLGVFAHEFGHDLGLPDFYDTNGGDNSTGFWTLMSSGSWLGHGKDSIGTTPGYMGAQEKVFLGWSDVQTVPYGSAAGNVTLGPADVDDKNAPQAIAVSLPDKTLSDTYNKPASGQYEWWSGNGNDRTSSLTRDIDLTVAKTASLSVQMATDTEEDFDFVYSQVSTDGGKNWTDLAKVSGTNMTWHPVSYDLSAYAGKAIKFRFQYVTDQAVNGNGVFLDDIALTIDGATSTDDVESGNGAWTAVGFSRITGSVARQVSHYYLAEYRRYVGYDATLKTGPYNFGFGGTDRPDWVEHFAYRPGMVVWYIDHEYDNNNSSKHAGHGSALPVDAHSKAMRWAAGPSAGKLVSNRITPFDASFGTQSVPALTLHRSGAATTFPAQPAATVFDDSNPDAYWDASAPLASTKVAGSGTRIEVKAQNDNLMRLNISFRK